MSNLDGWILYDKDNAPELNKLVTFIGKGGKVGMGVVGTWGDYPDLIIHCGAGHNSDYWVKDLYAWKYFDIPAEIIDHFGDINKKPGFSPILKTYLKNKGS